MAEMNDNPQTPQEPQNVKDPQVQNPQNGAGTTEPPKKKKGWRTAMLLGCGCLCGMAIVVGVFALLMLTECNRDKDETTPMIEELNVQESLVIKNNLDSVRIKELITMGMPKDSVLVTLGKPDSYLDANWGDYVTYDLNDSISVQINFSDNVVDGIQFMESVPEELLEPADSIK